jgi:hypothetical protein
MHAHKGTIVLLVCGVNYYNSWYIYTGKRKKSLSIQCVAPLLLRYTDVRPPVPYELTWCVIVLQCVYVSVRGNSFLMTVVCCKTTKTCAC